jgi:hypothetical protein
MSLLNYAKHLSKKGDMSVDSRPDLLSELPDNAVDIITDYVDPASIINLDLTARRYHAFFNQNALTLLPNLNFKMAVDEMLKS